MSRVGKWYEEASTIVNVHKDTEGSFLIYKGFKISKQSDVYKIQDVRNSEFYNSVSTNDYISMVTHGFIKGVDYVNYYNNLLRIKNLKSRIEHFVNKKFNAKEDLPNDKELNEKRIRVSEEKIKYYSDIILLLNSRNKYLKIKYSL